MSNSHSKCPLDVQLDILNENFKSGSYIAPFVSAGSPGRRTLMVPRLLAVGLAQEPSCPL